MNKSQTYIRQLIGCFGLFLLFILNISCTAAPLISKEALYGYYNNEKAEAFYVEFVLRDDGSFDSWLHETPEGTASWDLEDGNTIVITYPLDSSRNKKIKVLELNNDSAVLLLEGYSEPGLYTRSND